MHGLLVGVMALAAIGSCTKPEAAPRSPEIVQPAEVEHVPITRGQSSPEDTPKLHSEKGIHETITIETDSDFQRPIFKNQNNETVWSGKIDYHRLLVGRLLWGTQIREMENNVFDTFLILTAINPWDNVLMAGAVLAFEPRAEPTTYYHRTGPVGALFSELRSRKGGADMKAPVAVLGLEAGTQASYALPGQQFTFYEADPALVRLVANSDTYFSYIGDARKRGAKIEIRVGDRRLKLTEDKDRNYALILVDQAESFPVSKDVFTREAVQLYLDRLTEDGMIALHISNAYLQLEPMIAAIARDLKLTARVWNDSYEGRPGKTSSSWVVLTRKPEHLGSLEADHGTPLPAAADPKGFRRLKSLPDVTAWTDKNADVLILVMDERLQRIRRFLGLPTPIEK